MAENSYSLKVHIWIFYNAEKSLFFKSGQNIKISPISYNCYNAKVNMNEWYTWCSLNQPLLYSYFLKYEIYIYIQKLYDLRFMISVYIYCSYYLNVLITWFRFSRSFSVYWQHWIYDLITLGLSIRSTTILSISPIPRTDITGVPHRWARAICLYNHVKGQYIYVRYVF